MGPGVYSIFIRSSVIFTALLALIFFPEERSIIRQWQFQAGTFLGLVGAFGVLWFQPRSQTGHISLRGLVIAFVASFCWALYSVLVKRPSAELGSIRSFGVISVVTSAMLLPMTFFFGQIGTPAHVSIQVNLILILSAVTCITLAHVLYYIAIREIGVALAQTLQLLCPLGALGLSAWIFGERLSSAQVWSAAILLLGAFLAMKTKPIATTESAENI
jgi:drug/metabolite transporter (DMT)-like permease